MEGLQNFAKQLEEQKATITAQIQSLDAQLAQAKNSYMKVEGAQEIIAIQIKEEEAKASDASIIVENPSIASTDNSSSPRNSAGSKKLGTFEKKVCKEYSQLLEKDGLNFAENYLRSKRRYLRRGFHPKNYIQLGE